MQLEDILSPERCHCRIDGISKKRILSKISEIVSENIDSLEAPDVFEALMAPIDFDSLDGKPVDILFVLLVPHEEHDEHVRTLAELAALFNDEDFCYTIRHTLDSEDLYNIAITY